MASPGAGTVAVRVTTNAYGDTQAYDLPPLSALTTEDARQAHAHTVLSALVTQATTRGLWIDLPFDSQHSPWLAAALRLGFTAHSVRDNKVTLQAWSLASRNPTPSYGHHAAGAGALVVSSSGRILAIRERFDASGSYHPPGGHVDEGEDFCSAATREAFEETGVVAAPVGIVGFYELHLPVLPRAGGVITLEDYGKMQQSTRFGSTHLAPFVLCYAVEEALAPDADEVALAAWVTHEEYVQHAHEHTGALVRALAATGTLAAVAAMAQAHGDAKRAAAATSTHAAARGCKYVMTREDARIAEGVLASHSHTVDGLLRGHVVAAAHRRFDVTFPAFHYTALPIDAFRAAATAAPSTRHVLHAHSLALRRLTRVCKLQGQKGHVCSALEGTADDVDAAIVDPPAPRVLATVDTTHLAGGKVVTVPLPPVAGNYRGLLFTTAAALGIGAIVGFATGRLLRSESVPLSMMYKWHLL